MNLSRRKIRITRLMEKIPSGFTLMEVLISMTIMAVIALLIFTALRVGSRAWEKGEREIDRIHRQRIVLDLIQEQMKSICTKKIGKTKKKPHFLTGNQERLEFLSNRSLIPAAMEGIVRVTYRIKSDEESGRKSFLIREEGLTPSGDTGQSSEGQDSEKGFRVLLGGLSQVSVEYFAYQAASKGYVWSNSWIGNAKQAFPQAVRIRFYMHGNDHPATIVSQVAAWNVGNG